MRAIDADALIDDLKHDVAMDQDSLDYEELTDLNRENIQFDKDCKQNAIDLLQHAPTIEPERKTGRWIHDGYAFKGGIDWMHCSECGHKDSWSAATRTPFCAWCGTRMEGET